MIDRLKAWWAGAYRQRWMLALSGTFILAVATGALRYPTDTALMKLALNVWGATIGYWLDLFAAPYARPHDVLARMVAAKAPTDRLAWAIAFAAVTVRRVGLMGMAVFVTGLGV